MWRTRLIITINIIKAIKKKHDATQKYYITPSYIYVCIIYIDSSIIVIVCNVLSVAHWRTTSISLSSKSHTCARTQPSRNLFDVITFGCFFFRVRTKYHQKNKNPLTHIFRAVINYISANRSYICRAIRDNFLLFLCARIISRKKNTHQQNTAHGKNKNKS